MVEKDSTQKPIIRISDLGNKQYQIDVEIKEPQTYDTWVCPRCKQDYCSECIEQHKVSFYIEDEPEGLNQNKIQWNGLLVCPWCYNQLLRKTTYKKSNNSGVIK